MYTTAEVVDALMALGGDVTYGQRRRRTLAAVRASCEADLLPEWCIQLVLQRVNDEIMAGTWPFVADEESRW